MARSHTVFERQAPHPAAVTSSLATARDSCFWNDDAPLGDPRPALRSDRHTELAVVGGGFTGLWTAVRAKQRDPHRTVTLIEGGRLGWSASSRNGGFCAASLTHGEENGRSRWPEELARLDRLGRDNLAGIAATFADHGLDTEFEQTGSLSVAVEPHQVEWLRAAAAADEGTFLDEAAVRAEVASPTYLAGLTADGDALLHPAKAVRALAGLAESLGVEIVERTPVRSVETGRTGPVRLQTSGGTLTADRVALATNVFPALLRRYRRHTVPVYDYVVVTEPLTAQQRDAIGWHSRRGIDDLANQFHYYRLTGDGRILFGGYDAVHHRGGRVAPSYEHRPETYRRLTAHLLTTFPQLEGIRIAHRWAGPIDTCTRFCAFFGLARAGRVAHAAGFTGLGVGASRFAGDVMLDLLDGLDTERTRLRMVREAPLPFPPEPLASIGIELTRRSLDRADHAEGRRDLWLRTLDRAGLGFDS
ncbi:FAD-dependent oxidoreductase [Flexivirga sp. ID2601S]|uniref:FAD-dependent oxidoreductase n=1 Tax=Flexivirga aerilata TaxID=1656889 RepID=A0A849AE94_9MICO|nr:FAD-dependent oxidoreductase [Flexivirga aerilata]NNG38815.1 FAD-dependent oxidoreductase [Flexivirga aerilata]